MGLKVLLILCFIIEIIIANKNIFTITANKNEDSDINILNKFWRSTGFCPPKDNVSKYLLSDDVKLNLAYIGAMPNKAIEYVRIHWLLDLLTIKSISTSGSPDYDYTNMDKVFDWLYLQKLVPIFELMGNPSNYFNFHSLQQIEDWKYLVEGIISRYKDRYSADYISKWKFESWNEPDLRSYNTLNFTIESFKSYYNASQIGLRIASADLKIPLKMGGPAGLFKNISHHPLCWGILEYCSSISVAKSDELSLNFISFHKKGDGISETIANNSLKLINEFHEKYPNLKNLPVANTEADIMTGWSKRFEWRADVRYAAMVGSTIIDHIKKFKNMTIEVLSNDNVFLNYHPYYFTQRTLLTRFQMNNTNPPHLQFIKKPVYSLMALFSLLANKSNLTKSIFFTNYTVNEFDFKENFIDTDYEDGNNYEHCMVYIFHNETFIFEPKYSLQFRYGLAIKENFFNLTNYVVYMMNKELTNPYEIWKKAGSPVFPDEKLREKMREVEGPYRYIPPTTITNNPLYVDINVTSETILVVHLCKKSSSRLGPVTNLQMFNVTIGEVLLIWKDDKVGTRCIKTYEVEFLPEQSIENYDVQKFSRINKMDSILLSFQHVVGIVASGAAKRIQDPARGQYKVRAVDYWDRPGPYSKTITYPN